VSSVRTDIAGTARSLRAVLAALVAAVALLAVSAAPALAAPAGAWSVESIASSYLAPGSTDSYEVRAINLSAEPAGEVTITDTLPAAVQFKSVAFYWSGFEGPNLNAFLPICTPPIRQLLECSFNASALGVKIQPTQKVRMVIEVTVPPSAPEGPIVNEVSAEGAGASASASSQNTVSAHPTFGIANFTLQTVERTLETPESLGSGSYEFANVPDKFTQAGGHPWALVATGEVTNELRESKLSGTSEPVFYHYATRDPKDILTDLPPGLLGDPMAVPRCPLAVLREAGINNGGQCPADTILGWYRLSYFGKYPGEIGPIVNVAPAIGQSAEFALETTTTSAVTPILTAHLVRTAQGAYGFTVTSNGIPLSSLVKFELTFWGVPADPSHDAMRGRSCKKPEAEESYNCLGGDQPAGVAPVPFVSMPTDCAAGPEVATLYADSWEEPGSVQEGHYTGYASASTTLPAATGCNALSFTPGIEVQPDTQLADAPIGLGVNVQVPQPEQPGTNATPHLRNAVVTLPEGMSISPGIVDGIQACNESGPEGINFEGPESEVETPNGELQLAPGHCPDASIVGTAEAITPLLPEPIKGHVYLARPTCGGAGQTACTEEDALDGHLYQLYLELGGTGELANTGINIKAHGYVEANPATGQITTKFLENPQAPFSELKIHLNGGPRAPLDNPATCGLATTTADFTPWSGPGLTPEGVFVAGTPDATPSSFFEVEGCASAPGLSPGFSAGTVSPQAGAFSSFTLNFTRQDREQDLAGIQVHTPPGLLGMLSSVPLCPEPLAAEGQCPESSKIGTTRVASGAGSHPFEIGGNVYLTTSYKGSPFGLSIVTDAVAGPFNLGLVVVRARIDVNEETSALTVTSDPLPQIIFGVPLRLKQVTVDIDRPDFMFNPTDCAAQQITASISGSGQAVANVASSFAAGGCRSLAFKPTFTVATSGRTSHVDGASLDAKLTYPPFVAGSEANISYVKVALPKQLPSRLTTLQKACLATVFAANPASCPHESIVGVARASTPLLPVGLEGPVYFVSHGGEAFPSLVVVLQGDGVRVDLTASTFISKAGITSSTFKTVPDVPVGSFELYLPMGPYSALAANGNLCKSALRMPSEFVAQNGAVLKQNTRIAVSGCGKKSKKRAKQTRRARKTDRGTPLARRTANTSGRALR
jgi:uncharacterized repeat protein (TIGR01451 family)